MISDEPEESNLAGRYQILVREPNFINSPPCGSLCLIGQGGLINIDLRIDGELIC
mgnify:FL=1